jgi:hypothetical protein
MFSISNNNNINSNILEIMKTLKQKCDHCGDEKENCFNGYTLLDDY